MRQSGIAVQVPVWMQIIIIYAVISEIDNYREFTTPITGVKVNGADMSFLNMKLVIGG